MRKNVIFLLIFILSVSFLGPWQSAQASTSTWRTLDLAAQRISPELQVSLKTLAPNDMTTVIVTLRQQADLKNVGGKDKKEKQKAVIRALKDISKATQGKLKKLLDDRKKTGQADKYTSLWVINGISVTASASVIEELAGHPDVLTITPDDIKISPALGAPEPNIVLVNAPALWGQGFYGQGVVVASMDSGVDVSHPELATRWRGGSNSWFDPYGQHPTTPTDVSGHGTWTTGIMVGGDAGGTSLGVAPSAQWIAVKIFNDQGGSTATAIHEGFQWLLDPDGDPNTADAPQVVNNSWTFAYPGCNLEFELDLQSLRAADILPVFAAGNGGPYANTSYSPSNNPSAFAVGAIDNNSQIYAYSSRGPSTCGGSVGPFPELVAPGVNIKTTDLGGFYYTDSGTSFAAPHVAGGLALLLSAYPDLDVGIQEQALINSAVDLGASGPDDMFGYGRLDLLSAFNWILAVPPTATPTLEVIPSATPVQGPLPTDTPTSLPPSDTPTTTNTSVPPTPTYTFTPPPPTATNTPTPTESSVQVIGEVGQVTNLTNTLQTVTLNHSFGNPVVFAQPLTRNSSDPAVVRITDVQSSSFTLYIDEPPNLDGSHTTETVSYLVLEAGIWELDGGAHLEVSTVNTSATVGKRITNIWDTVNYSNSFPATPVVITQVQSNNDPGFVSTRMRNVGVSSFQVALEAEENASSVHGLEKVGWYAIETGEGNISGHAYQAINSSNSVTHAWYSVAFTQTFSSVPSLIMGMPTYDGSDSSHLRFRNLDANQFEVMVEEDTSYDSEMNHTSEVISYLAIDGEGLLTIGSTGFTATPAPTFTATNTPLPTATNTSIPPTSTNTALPPTATNTSVPPTATSTFTALPPTATNTIAPPTSTTTSLPPTATNTNVPPTATFTPLPPTVTFTSLPPTATNTNIPPTATYTLQPTVTNTVAPPTATFTSLPPTATFTALPPTNTPIPATPTNTPPPSGSDVIYLSSTSNGIAGGVAFRDEDILAFDTATQTWSLYFDGSDVGVTGDVNAFALMPDGSLLLSLTAPTTLSDVGSVDDSDIIRFTPTSSGTNTAGTFSSYFVGANAGLTTNGEDIDAIDFAPDGRLIVSTVGSYNVAGTSGLDEDLIALDPGGTSWSLYFDGSDVGLNQASTEEINGLWIDPASNQIYLTTLGVFNVTGLSGDGADIFICKPGSLGTTTACNFNSYWVGSLNGFAGEVVDGFDIVR